MSKYNYIFPQSTVIWKQKTKNKNNLVTRQYNIYWLYEIPFVFNLYATFQNLNQKIVDIQRNSIPHTHLKRHITQVIDACFLCTTCCVIEWSTNQSVTYCNVKNEAARKLWTLSRRYLICIFYNKNFRIKKKLKFLLKRPYWFRHSLSTDTMMANQATYRQFSIISRTQSQNINVSRLVLQLPLPNPFEARC